MTLRTPFVAPAVLLALLAGCAPQVDEKPPTEGTRAMFDPATGAIPLPSDVLRDQDTGLLAIPVDPQHDSKLTAEL